MLDTEPASQDHRPQLQRPEAVRVGVGVTIAIVAFAAGILIADLDHNVIAGVLRLVAAVLVILLGLRQAALRIGRRLRHIEVQLSDHRIDAGHAVPGLDPQVIAAARRISRRLGRRNST
jgi:hypothetical protein